jgi:hypothetical protein
MTDPSPPFGDLRDRLTLVKLRVHLLRFRYRGTASPPGRARISRGETEDPIPEGETSIPSGPTRSSRDGGSHTLGVNLAPRAGYPAVPSGTALEPGGVYIDLATSGGVPFVALRGQVAGSRNHYVSRHDVALDRWHGLVTGSHRRDPGSW